MSKVNTTAMIVLTILPAIPTVPLSTLVTLLKNDQSTTPMPFIKTYAIIPIRIETEITQHMPINI